MSFPMVLCVLWTVLPAVVAVMWTSGGNGLELANQGVSDHSSLRVALPPVLMLQISRITDYGCRMAQSLAETTCQFKTMLIFNP